MLHEKEFGCAREIIVEMQKVIDNEIGNLNEKVDIKLFSFN